MQRSKHHTLLGLSVPHFVNKRDIEQCEFWGNTSRSSAGSHSPQHHLIEISAPLPGSCCCFMEDGEGGSSAFLIPAWPKSFSRSESLPEGLQGLNSPRLCCWDPGDPPEAAAGSCRIKLLQAPGEGQGFLSGVLMDNDGSASELKICLRDWIEMQILHLHTTSMVAFFTSVLYSKQTELRFWTPVQNKNFLSEIFMSSCSYSTWTNTATTWAPVSAVMPAKPLQGSIHSRNLLLLWKIQIF